MADDVARVTQGRTDASETSATRRSALDEVLATPLQMLAGVGGLALLVALGILFAVSWRGLQRLEPFYVHLEQQEQLRQIERDIGKLLALDAGQAPAPAELKSLKDGIARLLHARPDRPSIRALADAINALDAAPLSRQAIETARARVGVAIDRARLSRETELAHIRSDARSEMVLAAIALLVLPGTAFLVLLILRDQITQPLRDLGALLNLIGEGQLRPAPASDIARPVRPVLEGYNRLVTQLTAALQSNKRYQDELQSQVKVAAQALVRQRAELAEADRLSAVGEMSARVGHELRNPLAGIKLAVANLSQESTDAPQKERLDLIGGEIDRMARLLDQLLVKAKRSDEPLLDVDLRSLVADLLALVRYQIPEHIALINLTPEGTVCRLQRDGVRQILLNLVLNSSQAMGERPGNITVSADRENQKLLISVCDDGPGFPSDLIERGIRPFVSRREGGSGLGLSTVQRMARAMGGKLEIANRQPNGAIAKISLKHVETP